MRLYQAPVQFYQKNQVLDLFTIEPSNNPKGILESLPQELLLHIFKYLDFGAFLHKIPVLNKRLCVLARSTTHYTLYFKVLKHVLKHTKPYETKWKVDLSPYGYKMNLMEIPGSLEITLSQRAVLTASPVSPGYISISETFRILVTKNGQLGRDAVLKLIPQGIVIKAFKEIDQKYLEVFRVLEKAVSMYLK